MSDETLRHTLSNYDALVVRSSNRITRSMMEDNPRLAVIGRSGSGVDNIDLTAAAELGIPVVKSPRGNVKSVAELVLGLMLGLARNIPGAHDSMKIGQWARKDLRGWTLDGKKLGIIGFGSIGSEVARLARAFGMTILIADSRLGRPDGEAGDAKVAANTATRVPLDELLSESDFVSLHVPLKAETKDMISAREIGRMKPTAVLINAARGGVVDEQDLLRALEQGELGGAALDTFCSEKAPLQDHVQQMCRLSNVICTPHIGASTAEAGEAVLREVCTAVLDVLKGRLSADRVVSEAPHTSLLIAQMRLAGQRKTL